MKKLATGTFAALLIAATTSLAMAQGHHTKRYYDYANGGVGAQSQDAQSNDYNTSPASTNAGIEQER